jgi:hypothetical protein
VEGKSDDEAKREIIDLSLAYSLSSRHTTFVAIEERQEATEGTMVRRTVPLNGLGYRQPIGGGARGGRGRGGFRGGAPRDSDRSCTRPTTRHDTTRHDTTHEPTNSNVVR